jgi:hypothetical protein
MGKRDQINREWTGLHAAFIWNTEELGGLDWKVTVICSFSRQVNMLTINENLSGFNNFREFLIKYVFCIKIKSRYCCTIHNSQVMETAKMPQH